jgi:hypothetical protein
MCVYRARNHERLADQLPSSPLPAPDSSTHDRNILEQDIELPRTGQQVLPDLGRNNLTLGDQLGSIELSYGSFQNFVSDRRKNTLIVTRGNVGIKLR